MQSTCLLDSNTIDIRISTIHFIDKHVTYASPARHWKTSLCEQESFPTMHDPSTVSTFFFFHNKYCIKSVHITQAEVCFFTVHYNNTNKFENNRNIAVCFTPSAQIVVSRLPLRYNKKKIAECSRQHDPMLYQRIMRYQWQEGKQHHIESAWVVLWEVFCVVRSFEYQNSNTTFLQNTQTVTIRNITKLEDSRHTYRILDKYKFYSVQIVEL